MITNREIVAVLLIACVAIALMWIDASADGFEIVALTMRRF